MDKAQIRLECLKLARTEQLKGNGHLNVADQYYDWVMQDENKPTPSEPAKADKPVKTGRNSGKASGASGDSSKANEKLFD